MLVLWLDAERELVLLAVSSSLIPLVNEYVVTSESVTHSKISIHISTVRYLERSEDCFGLLILVSLSGGSFSGCCGSDCAFRVEVLLGFFPTSQPPDHSMDDENEVISPIDHSSKTHSVTGRIVSRSILKKANQISKKHTSN